MPLSHDNGNLAIVAWMATQLTIQKKTDFKPQNDDDSFVRINTDPCIGCCDVLEKVGIAAKQNLSGKNLEVFLTEVGIAFHGYKFHSVNFCRIWTGLIPAFALLSYALAWFMDRTLTSALGSSPGPYSLLRNPVMDHS